LIDNQIEFQLSLVLTDTKLN